MKLNFAYIVLIIHMHAENLNKHTYICSEQHELSSYDVEIVIFACN